MTPPKIDKVGLHARDCECVRCALGNRPSPATRRFLEDRAHMAAVHEAQASKKQKTAQELIRKADETIKKTDHIIAGLAEIEAWNPEMDEIERLREESGLPPRRRKHGRY